jgi:hypothetical protein
MNTDDQIRAAAEAEGSTLPQLDSHFSLETIAAFEYALGLMSSDVSAERAEHEHTLWGMQQALDQRDKEIAELKAELDQRDRIEEERERAERARRGAVLLADTGRTFE